MTEADWFSRPTPVVLVRHLAAHPGLVSQRKWRLFGVACLRRLLPLLRQEVSRTALEVAERLADGQVTSEEAARAARAVADHQTSNPLTSSIDTYLGSSICTLCKIPLRTSDLEAVVNYTFALAWFVNRNKVPHNESNAQAGLLRDIVANPFRPVQIERAWLIWNEGLVPTLAQAIYHERTFDRLPILADALEDAGCDDLTMLTHLRDERDHVRGCWVLDRLLAKD
jgi:hypothetical protein